MTVDLLNEEFESNIGQLKSYLLRITASKADAEDIVQNTYLKAVDKINTFRGESSLKTWLFSIASNLAKDNLRAQKRWVENASDIFREEALADKAFFEEAMHIRNTSTQGAFEIKEHVSFCFTCVTKTLPLEQQVSLLLKEVYEFKT